MNQYFCENLQMFLEKFGMSKTELGKKLGVSEVAVSRWITGERNPRAEMITKMCEIFGCSYNDLMLPNSREIQEDREAYTEALELLEGLNTEGIRQVINYISNLNDRFLK